MRVLNIENQKEIVSKLERASYEVDCRKSILSFLINQNQSNSEAYKNYWEEYLVYNKAFQKLKYDFTQQYIIPVVENPETANWYVDFNTGEVTLDSKYDTSKLLPYVDLEIGNSEEVKASNLERLQLGHFFVSIDYGYGVGSWLVVIVISIIKPVIK